MAAMIEISGVHKAYGQFEVVKGVDLRVDKGEVLSIIGGSGSGKSTLLMCINGLEPIQRGSIRVDGIDVHARGTDLNRLRRKIGIVFQQWNAFPHLTVLENVMLAPRKVLGKCSVVAVLARIWKINDAVEMAPEDAQPIEYQRKLTRRGLGFTQARSSQTGGIASASQHPKYLQALAGRTSEYPTRRRLAQVARLSCAPNRHGTPGSSL
ncbi:ATP-binding cassette domain-containing protein [Pseudomonas aeruginosa]